MDPSPQSPYCYSMNLISAGPFFTLRFQKHMRKKRCKTKLGWWAWGWHEDIWLHHFIKLSFQCGKIHSFGLSLRTELKTVIQNTYKGIQSTLDKDQGIIRKLVVPWLCATTKQTFLAEPEESSVRVGLSLVPEWKPPWVRISGGTELNMEEALA